MESYRYQVKSQSDFKKFIGWLIDNKCNFTTRHEYTPSAGDHIYHVTVSLDAANVNFFKKIGSFLDTETDLRMVNYMNDLYESAKDAYKDPYCDAYTLHTMLGNTLDQIQGLNESYNANYEEMKKQIKSLTESKDHYQDNYYKELTANGRIKEQIRAIALLMDSILPKE